MVFMSPFFIFSEFSECCRKKESFTLLKFMYLCPDINIIPVLGFCQINCVNSGLFEKNR